MKHCIGLDVSMKRTFICVINEHGKIIREGSESTGPHRIADYLEKLGLEEMIVGFESGSLTPYLLTGFKERAHRCNMHGCKKAESYPCPKSE